MPSIPPRAARPQPTPLSSQRPGHRPVAELPALHVARACLAAGIPLTLLLDLAAGDELDSAEIMAVEQAGELAAAELRAMRERQQAQERRHAAPGA